MLAGMTCCLLSAYVSSFFAALFEIDLATAAHAVAPAVEECIKFLPILFYIVVFEAGKDNSINGIILVSVGFATFENVCFLTSYGTENLISVLLRGFGTGAMHVLCGTAIAIGLFSMWDRAWIRIMGTFAVLCFAITFHAIFNIMVSTSGISLWIASTVPMLLIILVFAISQRLKVI
jgi:RsiW-degrading membrane proteinase PrsW (M82 family)